MGGALRRCAEGPIFSFNIGPSTRLALLAPRPGADAGVIRIGTFSFAFLHTRAIFDVTSVVGAEPTTPHAIASP